MKFYINGRSPVASTTLTYLMVQVFNLLFIWSFLVYFLKTIHCDVFEISVNGRLWTTFSDELQFRCFSCDLFTTVGFFFPADFNTVFTGSVEKMSQGIFVSIWLARITFGYPPNPPWCGVVLPPTLRIQLAGIYNFGGLQLQACNVEIWSVDLYVALETWCGTMS